MEGQTAVVNTPSGSQAIDMPQITNESQPLFKCSWLAKLLYVLLFGTALAFLVLWVVAKVSDTSEKVKNLEDEVKTVKADNTKLKLSITQLEEEKRKFEQQIREKEGVITDLNKQMDKLKTQISDLQKEVEILKSESKTLKDKISELESKISQKEREINDLNSKIKKIEEELNLKNAELTKIKGQILWYQIGGGAALLGNVVEVIFLIVDNGKINDANKRAQEWQNKTIALEAHVKTLTETVEKQKADIVILNKKVDDLTNELNERKVEIGGLRKELEEVKKNLAAKEEELKQLALKYYDLDNKYQALVKENEALKKKYSDLEAENKKLYEKYLALNSTYYALNATYTDVLGNYTALKGKYEELNKNYNILNDTLKNLTLDYQKLSQVHTVIVEKLYNSTMQHMEFFALAKVANKTLTPKLIYSAKAAKNFTKAFFWEKVNNTANTLTIFHTNDSYYFGAYLNVTYNNYAPINIADKDAFLFSGNNSEIAKIATPEFAYIVPKAEDAWIVTYGKEAIKVFGSVDPIFTVAHINATDQTYKIPDWYAKETFYYLGVDANITDITVFKMDVAQK